LPYVEGNNKVHLSFREIPEQIQKWVATCKNKGSQLPKVTKASGKGGGTSSIPGQEGYDIPLVIDLVVKQFWEGKVSVGIFVVVFQ